jgi:hypothetical protein
VPRSIREVFPGYPLSWSGGIDAATYHDKEKLFYLFHGGEFTRAALGGEAEPPGKLKDSWLGLPQAFVDRDLDAVIFNISQNRFYLFKGNYFARHKEGKAPDEVALSKDFAATGLFADGNGFPGRPFFRGPRAATYVAKKDQWYFFDEELYAIKKKSGFFGSYDQIDGNWPNWPDRIAPRAPLDIVSNEANAVQLMIQTGHTDTVRFVTYLDSDRLISVGDDGIARVRNINTGKEVLQLGQYRDPGEVFALVDAQQRWLILGDNKATVQWDLQTLKKIRRIPTMNAGEMRIHGKHLVVLTPRYSPSAVVTAIDLETGDKVFLRLVSHTTEESKGAMTTTSEASILSADADVASGLVVTAGSDHISVWGNGKQPTSFKLSDNGKRQSIGASKLFTGLLSAATGLDIPNLNFSNIAVEVMFVNEDRNIVSGQLLKSFKGHDSMVRMHAVEPERRAVGHQRNRRQGYRLGRTLWRSGQGA